MKKLVIVGLGETADLAYEYFSHDSNYTVVAFAASRGYIFTECKFHGLPVVAVEDLSRFYSVDEYKVFIAISSGHLNRDRMVMYNLIKSMGYQLASYVSSRAFVWHNVEIGENCFILEDNTLQPFVKIGDNVTLWSGNHIGHRSMVGNHCFITSHVVISGFCEIKESCFVGVNSSVADNVTIGKDNFIAMGTVINKNTDENKIFRGNPAVTMNVGARKFCEVEG